MLIVSKLKNLTESIYLTNTPHFGQKSLVRGKNEILKQNRQVTGPKKRF
jgi:hypothetical protein